MSGSNTEGASALSAVADTLAEVAGAVADTASEAEIAANASTSSAIHAVDSAVAASDALAAAREVEELAERARQRETMEAADTIAEATADQSAILSRQEGLEQWQRHHEQQLAEMQSILATVLETVTRMSEPEPEILEAEPLSTPPAETLTTAELTTEPSLSGEGDAPKAPYTSLSPHSLSLLIPPQDASRK